MVSSTIVASKCSSNLLTHFFLAKPLIRSLAQPQLFGAMSAQIARNRDSWWVMQKLSIFFPSNAVWLSPGRSTCVQSCCM